MRMLLVTPYLVYCINGRNVIFILVHFAVAASTGRQLCCLIINTGRSTQDYVASYQVVLDCTKVKGVHVTARGRGNTKQEADGDKDGSNCSVDANLWSLDACC